MTAGGDAETDDGGLAVIDELGIGLVEQIVDAEGERQILIGAVGNAEPECAESARGTVVRARDAAVAPMIAVLTADEAPDGVCLDFFMAVFRREIRLERCDLRERRTVCAVLAARVGERGAKRPARREFARDLRLEPVEARIYISVGRARVHAHPDLRQAQDVVVDVRVIEREVCTRLLALVDPSEVELCVLLTARTMGGGVGVHAKPAIAVGEPGMIGLPVVRGTLRMSDADVERERLLLCRAFPANEAADGTVARTAGDEIAREHPHRIPEARVMIVRVDLVVAQTREETAARGEITVVLEEYAEILDVHVVAERSLEHPMCLGEEMRVMPHLDADGTGALWRETQIKGGARTVLHAFHICAHRHPSCGAQGVVVHDVVNRVVVELNRELLDHRREVCVLEFHTVAVAVELRAVHHAVCVFCPAAAAVVGDLEEGIGIGRQTDDARQAVAAVARVDAVPAAVLVVLRIIARLDEAQVAPFAARRDVDEIIEPVTACAEHGDISAHAGGFKTLCCALKDDIARNACTVADALRSLVHDDAAERLGEGKGSCGVHAVRAAACHPAAVHVHHHA